MRKTIVTIAALSAITLTGCDDSTEKPAAQPVAADPGPSALPTEEPEPVEPTNEYGLTERQVEDLYTSHLRSEFPQWFGVLDDKTLLDSGYKMCELFEMGKTFEDVAFMTLEAGYPSNVGGAYIGITVEAFCPDLGVLD